MFGMGYCTTSPGSCQVESWRELFRRSFEIPWPNLSSLFRDESSFMRKSALKNIAHQEFLFEGEREDRRIRQ